MGHPTTAPTTGIPRGQARKAVFAGGIGNFIEWYDYGVYAALSPVISGLFFPASNPVASTLAALAVFGVGVVALAPGGVVLGQLGDRQGRREGLSVAPNMGACGALG